MLNNGFHPNNEELWIDNKCAKTIVNYETLILVVNQSLSIYCKTFQAKLSVNCDRSFQ